MKYLTSFLYFIVYLCLSLSLFVGCTETQTTPMTPSEDPDNQTKAFTETVTIITKSAGRVGAISGPPLKSAVVSAVPRETEHRLLNFGWRFHLLVFNRDLLESNNDGTPDADTPEFNIKS